MIDLPDYRPTAWHWTVAGDTSRYWSSAAGRYVAKLPKGAGVTAIASEQELCDVLAVYGLLGPGGRRLVPKRVIVDRLHAAGLLGKAKAAIDAADLYTQERWNSRIEIYADDPTALDMLARIGADPAAILAP